MAHLRPDAKVPKHRLSACRKGRHRYGTAQFIGAGITRQVCETCGGVKIDLTAAEEGESPLAETQRTMNGATNDDS